MSLGKALRLERASYEVVPQIFEGLAQTSRTVLMEVACHPDSLLASTVQSLANNPSAASRCGQWNACDLATAEGVRLVLKRVALEKPRHVWISPPGGAFSPMQRSNQRGEEQRRELKAKRQEAIDMYKGCVSVATACLQEGIHVSWEWPEHSDAWRLPFMRRFREQFGLHEAVTKGCRVNARQLSTQQLLSKGWRIWTSCARLAEVMHLPCRCDKGYQHGQCVGPEALRSERYTYEFAKRVGGVFLQELSHQQVLEESSGKTRLPEGFGDGSRCMCQLFGEHHVGVRCGGCLGGLSSQAGLGLGNQPQAGTPTQGEEEKIHSLGNQCTGEGIQGVFGVMTAEELEAFMSKEAYDSLEAEAQSLYQKGQFQHDTCQEHLAKLPLAPVARHRKMLGSGHAVYLAFGMYAHEAQYGITNRSYRFRHLVRYLNGYLDHWDPEQHPRTSLVVSLNNLLPLHKDNHNDARYNNHVIGLGPYTGGELWVEGSVKDPKVHQVQERVLGNGDQVQGYLAPTRHQVVSFAPNKWHETQKWKGDRWMISGYVARGWQFLGMVEQGLLSKMGFHCPREAPQEAYVQEPSSPSRSSHPRGPEAPASKQQIESIKKKLYLLHAATGHGSKKGLVEALKRRGASELVLGLAREFTCSVCAEKKRPPPRNLASLEVLPPKWHTVSTDIGHWFHAHKNLHVQFMLVIDEGSRFRIAKVLTRGSKQQPTGADCVAYLREGWMQVFGTPDTLRLDPAGAFRGETMANFCDRHSIYLDMIPADAHWQIGTCEQAIKGTKELMTKLCDDDPELSPEEALSVAVRTFNSREQIRGFTPIQHAFGRNPDVTGRVIERPQAVPEELLSEGTGLDFEASARRRATAEKALCDWQAQQRISRATNSRSRPSYDYVPGELVYYWRSQASGRSRQQPGGRQGFFLGPARVLATETRRSPEGQLRPGSSIWIVKGRTLLKCCPEQLRRASPREELIEALSTSRNQDPTPWTFQRVVEEIGGNQYEDISGEQPGPSE